jgi:hypothetical protein
MTKLFEAATVLSSVGFAETVIPQRQSWLSNTGLTLPATPFLSRDGVRSNSITLRHKVRIRCKSGAAVAGILS